SPAASETCGSAIATSGASPSVSTIPRSAGCGSRGPSTAWSVRTGPSSPCWCPCYVGRSGSGALPHDVAAARRGSRPARAPGDGSDLTRAGEIDGEGREQAERDGDPPGDGVSAGDVVQRAGDPGAGGAADDGREHQHAEDAAVVAAL